MDLETQINDWNGVHKLLTRYEELSDISKSLNDCESDTQEWQSTFNGELLKLEKDVMKCGPNEYLFKLRQALKSF